jgi:predicted permease
LFAIFMSVFLTFGLGFAIQRFRPLGEQTLAQMSGLVVDVLLPIYLFFTTATGFSIESLSSAPLLVVMGIAIPLFSFGLATLTLRPSKVADTQRSAFRFSIMVANTAFLGIPICEALFGPEGGLYAVLYDFGTTLVVLTLGIWELDGTQASNWRALVFNPLILSVFLGMLWAWTGWQFPTLLAQPISALGGTALSLALLMNGAQVGNVRLPRLTWWRPLIGVVAVRLCVVPLIVGVLLAAFGWWGLPRSVIVIESAMPVGLTAAIMAKSYGADAQFSASAVVFSTLLSIVSLPLLTTLSI